MTLQASPLIYSRLQANEPIHDLFADSELQVFGCDHPHGDKPGTDLLAYGFPGAAKGHDCGFNLESFKLEIMCAGEAKWFRLDGINEDAWVTGTIGESSCDMCMFNTFIREGSVRYVEYFEIRSPWYKIDELSDFVKPQPKTSWVTRLLAGVKKRLKVR